MSAFRVVGICNKDISQHVANQSNIDSCAKSFADMPLSESKLASAAVQVLEAGTEQDDNQHGR
jgi:hypothetical protein